MKANEGTQAGDGDGSGGRAGTAIRTGVETRGRTQDGDGDESGDGNDSSSGDGNEDGDDDEIVGWRRRGMRAVDMMWETGETCVERGKNADKRGKLYYSRPIQHLTVPRVIHTHTITNTHTN